MLSELIEKLTLFHDSDGEVECKIRLLDIRVLLYKVHKLEAVATVAQCWPTVNGVPLDPTDMPDRLVRIAMETMWHEIQKMPDGLLADYIEEALKELENEIVSVSTTGKPEGYLDEEDYTLKFKEE